MLLILLVDIAGLAGSLRSARCAHIAAVHPPGSADATAALIGSFRSPNTWPLLFYSGRWFALMIADLMGVLYEPDTMVVYLIAIIETHFK